MIYYNQFKQALDAEDYPAIAEIVLRYLNFHFFAHNPLHGQKILAFLLDYIQF